MESVDSASEIKVEQEYRLAYTCRVQAPQQEPGAGDVIWMRWPWNAENGHDDRITTYRTGKKHTHTQSPMRVASDLRTHSVRGGTGKKANREASCRICSQLILLYRVQRAGQFLNLIDKPGSERFSVVGWRLRQRQRRFPGLRSGTYRDRMDGVPSSISYPQ